MHSAPLPRPPSIDRVLNWTAVAPLIAEYGREPVLAGVRSVLDSARQAVRSGDRVDYAEPAVAADLAAHLAQRNAPRLKRVFNLSGTVLHTNLGRAPLPVIGRISEGALRLDLRCLSATDEADFLTQLAKLAV